MLLLLLAVWLSLSTAQVIVESPNSMTIFLHREAVFLCLTRRGTTHWRVNGIDLPSDLYADLVTDSTSLDGLDIFSLTVPGRAEYNGTRVQCVTEGGGDSAGSSIATLEIQGQLASVGNLTLENSPSFITISWTAPFSLDVTNVDPDVWYSVLIYNVTDETAVSVPYLNCTNITETFCVFTPDYLSPCHNYTFRVIPYNGAGQGVFTENVMGYTYQVPPGIGLSKANISASKTSTTNKYSVIITVPLLTTTGTELCFWGYPESFIIYYASSQQHCSNTSSVVTSEAPESGNIWQIQSVVQLVDNCNYTVHNIVSRNEAGETNSTGSLSISTTLILVNVNQANDGVDVLCSFQYALAKSCYVQLVSDTFHEGQYLEGEGEAIASHSFTGLNSGTYTVLVYGLSREETSCSPPHDPDYVTVVSVTAIASQHTSVASVPVITHEPGSPSEGNSHSLCLEGVGVGVGVGAVMTSLICVLVIIVIKVIIMCKQRKDVHSMDSDERKVSMKRNVAYELHNPQSQRPLPEQTRPSQTLPPIYEEL